VTDVPQARPPAATPRTTTPARTRTRGTGDLGLATPISQPACDGTGIVVVGNAVNASTRTADISTYLRQYPGSQYLRTDVSCGSLRDRDDYGNVIYAVYRVAGRSRSDICSLRAELGALAAQLGNDAPYGKWLDNTTDPSTFISPADCGQ
jgi:serine/threonine-protein kinase